MIKEEGGKGKKFKSQVTKIANMSGFSSYLTMIKQEQDLGLLRLTTDCQTLVCIGKGK